MSDLSISETETLAEGVEDEAEHDPSVASVSYQISSYGADYDVDGLVKRLRNQDIFVPPFQRNYVWTFRQASRFIESLLLGLPVPGIFLAREESSNKFLILDGQQRLKTLLFFYDGLFAPPEKTQHIFSLSDIQRSFEGKTYKTLDDRDRRRLDDSIIHATIVKQEAPPEDEDTSLYYIFERLNSGETRVTPQEARSAVFHGSLLEKVKELNELQNWRKIFGKKHARLKDQELILRFLAFFYRSDDYHRPMAEFLNKFASKNKKAGKPFLDDCQRLFTSAIGVAWEALGEKAFRPERALNAAVFDSVMVGLANRVRREEPVDTGKVSKAYQELLRDEKYFEAVSRSTADEGFVSLRIKKAIDCFGEI